MRTFLTAGSRVAAAGFAAAVLSAAPTADAATKLLVTIENLSPTGGTLLTPFWVGFHDGTFDLYDRGESIQNMQFAGLETLAEDGITSGVSDRFAAEALGGVDGTLFGPDIPPLRPGETTTQKFNVDGDVARYFSYASMVIPSNDAFIANGNPLAFEIFDVNGMFLGVDFTVLGEQVLDAGTEVNDEVPENTAALAQMAPNTGVDENGFVELHPGFLPGGNVLAAIPNGDFLAPGYQVARITVTQVPVPASALIALGGIAALLTVARVHRSS